jgi:2-polyprenyl-3-methyl-5-hydroxy-6-metoxy-1,4-benzoquinol methylase
VSSSDRPSLREQRRFWDWHWEHWQERRTINDWKDKRHDTILTVLSSLRLDRPKLLDLGCGPGWYTEKLARFGEVTAIDLSDEAINIARSRYPGITFTAGNFYQLPIPLEHFDVVVSQEVIDHVEDQVAFLDRAACVLKPDGYLVLSCANQFVMDRLAEGELPPQLPGHISRWRSVREWKRLLARRFEVLWIRSILPIVGRHGILRFTNSHTVNTAVGALIGRERVTALKEWAGLGYTLIVLARKVR